MKRASGAPIGNSCDSCSCGGAGPACSTLPDMYVKMPPSRFGAMSMRLVFELDGYANKASVAYAALGNNMLSEAPDIAHSTLEHCDLQATVVIQVDVHRRDRQIMVVVKGSGQALRQFPFPVIIDVYKRRHAKLGVVYLALHVGNSGSSEIADRLGPDHRMYDLLIETSYTTCLRARRWSSRCRPGSRIVLPCDGDHASCDAIHALHIAVVLCGGGSRPLADDDPRSAHPAEPK